MKQLPVYQHRREILAALETHQVIVVESPTGSGKTTQLPIILHEAGYTADLAVGITQPRRIATLSVCDYIKRQLGDMEGSLVGYKMRFSDTTDRNTRIKVMTDGILLQELKADPLLRNYGVMLVDEAHERSLNIDFILGLLKGVLSQRADFKVIISSATINTNVFSQFFDSAPIISIDARIHPVEVFYMPQVHAGNSDEMMDQIVRIVVSRVKEKAGDILIFLPGEFEIKTCMQLLHTCEVKRHLVLYPLYGRLSKDEQERVFIPTPKDRTKVVVATNIAETSITIDGITTVIDSGMAKMNFYNQKDFTSSLVPLPVSKSSCEQRKGRAGRTAPGACYRLYSKHDFDTRFSYTTEEILRTDLSEVVLRMSDLGIYDFEKFPFITRPKAGAIASAEETLKFIKAIGNDRHLTSIGELMVRFPLLPRHSRVIVEGMLNYPDVIDEVLIAVAFLSTKTPFVLPPGEEDAAREAHKAFNTTEYGDFLTYLSIFKQFSELPSSDAKEKFCKRNYLDMQSMTEIVHVDEQLAEIVSELGFPLSHGGSVHDYLCCLAAGLLQYVCCRSKGNMYKSLTANQIYIHPGSAWFREPPQFIIAGEIVQTSRMYARSVSPLKKEWLDQIDPMLRPRLLEIRKHDAESRRIEREARRDERRDEEKKRRTGKDGRAPTIRDTVPETQTPSATVYRRTYPVEFFGKKKNPVVVIPLSDLSWLYTQNMNASRRPKNFSAALAYHGSYIHYGDKFFNILELNGKVDTEKGILESPPSGQFSASDPSLLVDNLMWILALCRLKKERGRLGFIELDTNGNGMFMFKANKNGLEALDTSIYSLGQLLDDLDRSSHPNELRVARKTYERLMKLFDN